MTKTFEKKNLEVVVAEDKTQEVEVYESSTEGLVVHRQVKYSPGKGEHRTTSKWQVTHEPTGLAMLSPTKCLPRQKDALKMAKRLGELDVDWGNTDRDYFSSIEGLKDQLHEVYEKTVKEQEAEEEGLVVYSDNPRYIIEPTRDERHKRVYAVKDNEEDEVVETFPHRGQAFQKAHELNEEEML